MAQELCYYHYRQNKFNNFIGGFSMVKFADNTKKLIKNVVEREAILSANSTTCVALYQPKAPAALKKFSKVDNDK